MIRLAGGRVSRSGRRPANEKAALSGGQSGLSSQAPGLILLGERQRSQQGGRQVAVSGSVEVGRPRQDNQRDSNRGNNLVDGHSFLTSFLWILRLRHDGHADKQTEGANQKQVLGAVDARSVCLRWIEKVGQGAAASSARVAHHQVAA